MPSSKTPDRILTLLKTGGPRTAAELAGELGITTAGVRQHLVALVELGLLDHEDRRTGVGRPSRYYVLTEKADRRFPETHSELTLQLIDGIREEFGEQGLDALIRRRERDTLAQYSEELESVTTLPGKLRRLAAIRSREGYMAEIEKCSDGSWLLIENHCPICAAAKVCQGFCRSELEQFRRLFRGLASVEREDHILAGARRCVYRVRRT